MLQRIQSLYLFIGAVLMAVYAFIPMGTITSYDAQGTYVLSTFKNGPHLLLITLNVLVVVLSLITIFKFKDLKSQLKLCAILIALTVTLVASSIIMLLIFHGTIGIWGNVVALIAIAMYALAYRGVNHDIKLLADSERIR